MIKKLSIKCKNFIISFGAVHDVSETVLVYGLELIITSLIGLAILIVLSVILGHPLAWLFFVFGFAPLRTSAGGYHANTHVACYCVTSIMFSSSTIFAYYLKANTDAYVFIALMSLVVVWLLAPVEAVNKPLSPKKAKVNRGKSIIIVLVNLCVALVFYWMKVEHTEISLYFSGIFFASLSLLVGKVKLQMKGGKKYED